MDTNQKKEKSYDIVNGPGKDALFDACKYACVKGANIPISFDVVAGYTMPKGHPDCAYVKMPTSDFRIIGIANEDGSGESFNFHGYVKRSGTQYRFKAYYNTKRREGAISFFK